MKVLCHDILHKSSIDSPGKTCQESQTTFIYSSFCHCLHFGNCLDLEEAFTESEKRRIRESEKSELLFF